VTADNGVRQSCQWQRRPAKRGDGEPHRVTLGDGLQVPRRGTCKGVRAGSGGSAALWWPPPRRLRAAAGRLGGRSSLEAAGEAGGGEAVREVVEAGGDAGDVERAVGVDGLVGFGRRQAGRGASRGAGHAPSGSSGAGGAAAGQSEAPLGIQRSSSPATQCAIPKRTRRWTVRDVFPLGAVEGPVRYTDPAPAGQPRRAHGLATAAAADAAAPCSGPTIPAYTCST
jgi:hypothetical protein